MNFFITVSTSRFGGPVANGDNGESWVFPDEDQEAPLPDAEAPASGILQTLKYANQRFRYLE